MGLIPVDMIETDVRNKGMKMTTAIYYPAEEDDGAPRWKSVVGPFSQWKLAPPIPADSYQTACWPADSQSQPGFIVP